MSTGTITGRFGGDQFITYQVRPLTVDDTHGKLLLSNARIAAETYAACGGTEFEKVMRDVSDYTARLLLIHLVVSWDLTHDSGEPVPVAGVLELLPSDVLWAFLDDVGKTIGLAQLTGVEL